MTSRERILAALERRPADRIPWTPLIDGYYLSGHTEWKNQVDAVCAFGGDVFARHIPVVAEWNGQPALSPTVLGHCNPCAPLADGARVISHTANGNIELETVKKGGHIRQFVRTPAGELSCGWVFNENATFIPFPTEHRLKTVEDLKPLRYCLENTRYTEIYDVFAREDAFIGDRGIATATLPVAPLMTLLEIEYGVENFYYMLADYPDEIRDIMDLMRERNKEFVRLVARSPAKVVISYENTSTTLLSPALYREHVMPVLREYADILHAADKIFLTHMCGKLKGLARELNDSAMDGIIDVAPPPTGDVPIADAARFWPDKAVMGGIDATQFTDLTPDETEAFARGIIQSLRGRRGTLLGSGDATPKTARFENMLAVTRAVMEGGGI